MKKEDLFEGFSALDDELLKRSEQASNVIKNKRSTTVFIRYISIAACLLVVIGAGVLWLKSNKKSDVNIDSDRNIMAEGIDDISNGQNDTLLEKEIVNIGEYQAVYYKVDSVDSNKLKESVGSKVEETQIWYRVSGHEDMQYIIMDNDNDYSLWIFDSFQSERYPYNDVLEIIYDINSAEDIIEIIVAPATMDNTDEGKVIQDEIGTLSITDEETINKFYEVVSGLTCYGSGRWDMIGLNDTSHSGMQAQVKAGRYLTFVTSQGLKLDTLKYTGITGMFYEYGGIAYNVLTSNDKVIVEEILNIE